MTDKISVRQLPKPILKHVYEFYGQNTRPRTKLYVSSVPQIPTNWLDYNARYLSMGWSQTTEVSRYRL